MAITFRRGPRTLVEEIKRSGYRIVEVTSDIGDPSRSLQIALQNGVVVNWDRDSYSVWANGPHPSSEKVEAYIASLRGRRKTHSASRIFLWLLLVLLATLALALAFKKDTVAPTTTTSQTVAPSSAAEP